METMTYHSDSLKGIFELTSSNGDKLFVRTNMTEQTMGDEVLDFIATYGHMDTEKFIKRVNSKGVYKVEVAKEQNPEKYIDGDTIDRAKLLN